MKFIPIPFLLIAIFFTITGYVQEFEVRQSNIVREDNINEEKVTTLLTNLNAGIQTIQNQPRISFGESPGSPELLMSRYELQQSRTHSISASLREQIEMLKSHLKLETEYRKQIQSELEKKSKWNINLMIALTSLIVSVLAMLPPWIQLVKPTPTKD